MSEITEFVNTHQHADITPPTLQFLRDIEEFNWSQLDLYFYLDQLLVDRIGQSLTYNELIKDIQTNHRELFDLIFKPTFDIVNALPKT
jgi:hypothetical protein